MKIRKFFFLILKSSNFEVIIVKQPNSNFKSITPLSFFITYIESEDENLSFHTFFVRSRVAFCDIFVISANRRGGPFDHVV